MSSAAKAISRLQRSELAESFMHSDVSLTANHPSPTPVYRRSV